MVNEDVFAAQPMFQDFVCLIRVSGGRSPHTAVGRRFHAARRVAKHTKGNRIDGCLES